MTIAVNSKEAQEIRKLIPLATISFAHFEQICDALILYSAQEGEYLFRRGETDTDLIYLLEGKISLQADGLQVEVIEAKNFSSRFALAHQHPRKIDALALTTVVYLRLEPMMLASEPLQTMSILEDQKDMLGNDPEGDANDWMTVLLKSPIFKTLPPANLQKLLIGLSRVDVAKGTRIIKQGELSDFFYFIKSGECIIARRPAPNAREVNLVQLRIGDTFGEDSLLSEQSSHVSVIALTEVALLRLSKVQFFELIKEPTLKYLESDDLKREMQLGAVFLDVRSQEEFRRQHVKEAVNVPFFSLRMQIQLRVFDRSKPIIVACQDGKISDAACFLLLRNKYVARVLRKGYVGILANPGLKGEVVKDEGLLDPSHFLPPPGLSSNSLGVAESELGTQELTKEQLLLEVAQLKALAQNLSHHCEQLRQEREVSDKQLRIVLKQNEKLKEVLNKLKAGSAASS